MRHRQLRGARPVPNTAPGPAEIVVPEQAGHNGNVAPLHMRQVGRPTHPARSRDLTRSEPSSVIRRTWSRTSRLTVSLVLADIAVGCVAVAATPLAVGWGAALILVTIGCRIPARLYRRRLRLSYLDDLPRALVALFVAVGVTAGLIPLLARRDVDVLEAVQLVLGFGAASELARMVVLQLVRWARVHFRRGDRTIVVGAGTVGRDLAVKMQEHPEFGLLPIGFVDSVPVLDPAGCPVPVLEADLASAIIEHNVSTVVLAFSAAPESQIVDSAITGHRLGCAVLVVPRMFEIYYDAVEVERLRSYPLVRLPTDPTRRPTWRLKRFLDALAAALALVVAAPVIGICIVAVLIELGRPVFFRQERVGLDGETFEIYKLRTLAQVEPGEMDTTWSIANDPRVGPVGRFLRRTSLDEVPQLFNILRGEMSIVGPRPERPGFVRQFVLEHERYWARHRVPAGLTGLAQVNGMRGDTSIADRARFDNYYIATWSLGLDLKVILLTVRELMRRGAR